MREFDLDKLNNAIGKEEYNGCVIQIVYIAYSTKSDIQDVLAMIIGQNSSEVFRIELRSFAYSKHSDERGKEGDGERKVKVEETHEDEKCLEQCLKWV